MRVAGTTLLCLSTAAGAALAVRAQSTAATPGAPADPTSPIVHVVLFDLTGADPSADARAIADDSRRLLAGIPGVQSVWVGPKALDDRDVHVKDYDVALCVRLRSLDDLKSYGPHPQHRELIERWKGRATWRVVDFYDR
jgi:Stress responsive A/B Barrel Domain